MKINRKIGGRWSTETIIQAFKDVHGDQYDYSEVQYKSVASKVKITCPIHGPYEQTPNSHLGGSRCKQCGWEHSASQKRGNREKFIERAKEKYGDFYDYSLVEYVNARTHVKISCPKHGIFEQVPDSHINKKGMACKTCSREAFGLNLRKDTKHFVKRARKVHGERFDYSKAEYVKNNIPLTIICREHGEFSTTPVNHMLKMGGCAECHHQKFLTMNLKPVEDFIERSIEIHSGKYTYDKVEYEQGHDKVWITCPEHGDFYQSRTKHTAGKRGCPRCADKIRYIYQYHCHKQNDMYYTDARSNIYIMRFTLPNNGDTFIKIGLSVNVDERRCRLQLSSGADVEILYQMENRADHLRLCEHSTFELFKDYEYFPVEKFDGHSECFVEELYDDLVDYIEKYMYDAALFEANLPNPSDFDIDRLRKESQNDHSSAA